MGKLAGRCAPGHREEQAISTLARLDLKPATVLQGKPCKLWGCPLYGAKSLHLSCMK